MQSPREGPIACPSAPFSASLAPYSFAALLPADPIGAFLRANERQRVPCDHQLIIAARGRLRIGSPCGRKAQFARRRDSHFAIERRLSTKPHFDLVPTPIIHESHEERTSRDLGFVYFCERDAPTDAARVLDGN